MPEATHSSSVVRFGVFELDLRAGELRKQGLKIKLQDKPFRVLAVLVENAGEVVTREELRQQLWPPDTFVDFEHSVNTAIRKLREALGDSAENPRFIETLPRHGYRFIGQLGVLGGLRTAPPATKTDNTALRLVPERPPPEQAQGRGLRRRFGFFAGRPDKTLRYAAGGLGAVLVFTLAVAFDVGGLRERVLERPAGRRIESIAVLPLRNLTGDPQQEYLAEGLTGELITTLGKISAVRVISRTSVMRYKHSDKSVPEIARELHVDAIVEGALGYSGKRLRITASLIYVPTDRQVWADSFESDSQDMLLLQSQVAHAIVSELRTR